MKRLLALALLTGGSGCYTIRKRWKDRSIACIRFDAPRSATRHAGAARHPSAAAARSDSTAALRDWAKRIRKWRHELKAIYLYFDNDQAGYAAQNALTLRKLVTKGSI